MITEPATILVVDDEPRNVRLLADILMVTGYQVITAASGREALAKVEGNHVHLVLLDVIMPDLNGYEVCKTIRANKATELLPVVMVTALDGRADRIRGIEAGADDFLSKPIDQVELLARVKNLLRVGQQTEQIRKQNQELARLTEAQKHDISEQQEKIKRLMRFTRLVPHAVANEILCGNEDCMKPHRRPISAVFVDMRGFTEFARGAEPEDVWRVLREFHQAMGPPITEREGTLAWFAGDGMLIMFNAPAEVKDGRHEARAVEMAVAMREAGLVLKQKWLKRDGIKLGVGFGIHSGHATLGEVGFEEQSAYAAIGTVVNLASRLCDEAEADQIVISQRVHAAVEELVEVKPRGPVRLKGISEPMETFNVVGLRAKAPV